MSRGYHPLNTFLLFLSRNFATQSLADFLFPSNQLLWSHLTFRILKTPHLTISILFPGSTIGLVNFNRFVWQWLLTLSFYMRVIHLAQYLWTLKKKTYLMMVKDFKHHITQIIYPCLVLYGQMTCQKQYFYLDLN